LTPTFGSYLVGLPAIRRYEQAERRRCEEHLAFLGLGDLRELEVGELPYGQAKLVDLARALAAEPRVLLLDEPASGLAADGREKMAGVLRRIQKDYGMTQVVVEHDMTLVNRVCDRLVVMSDGSKLAEGDPSIVLGDKAVVEALLG
jgi:branched-chain amino acid transport system ATP-binding protein